MRGGGRFALGGSTARLSTEALESCLRCVICKGMKVGKATCVNRAGFFCVAKGDEMLYTMPSHTDLGLRSRGCGSPNICS